MTLLHSDWKLLETVRKAAACCCRYTGLAGFFDAFILRNLLAWQSSLMLEQCDDLDRADEELFTLMGIPHMPAPAMSRRSLAFRVSSTVALRLS